MGWVQSFILILGRVYTSMRYTNRRLPLPLRIGLGVTAWYFDVFVELKFSQQSLKELSSADWLEIKREDSGPQSQKSAVHMHNSKTKTKTNPSPDPNRYRRHCPDPNARIQKFIHYMAIASFAIANLCDSGLSPERMLSEPFCDVLCIPQLKAIRYTLIIRTVLTVELHTACSLKVGFHYPSSRPELTGVKKCTRVLGPSTRPVNSGSGNRP